MTLLNPGLSIDIDRIPHAYPIFTLRYREYLEVINNYLKNIQNLYHFGRNAMFRYNNMDQAIEMGILAANASLYGGVSWEHVTTERHWFG
jgi:UDP-galactopyranose mutase